MEELHKIKIPQHAQSGNRYVFSLPQRDSWLFGLWINFKIINPSVIFKDISQINWYSPDLSASYPNLRASFVEVWASFPGAQMIKTYTLKAANNTVITLGRDAIIKYNKDLNCPNIRTVQPSSTQEMHTIIVHGEPPIHTPRCGKDGEYTFTTFLPVGSILKKSAIDLSNPYFVELELNDITNLFFKAVVYQITSTKRYPLVDPGTLNGDVGVKSVDGCLNLLSMHGDILDKDLGLKHIPRMFYGLSRGMHHLSFDVKTRHHTVIIPKVAGEIIRIQLWCVDKFKSAYKIVGATSVFQHDAVHGFTYTGFFPFEKIEQQSALNNYFADENDSPAIIVGTSQFEDNNTGMCTITYGLDDPDYRTHPIGNKNSRTDKNFNLKVTFKDHILDTSDVLCNVLVDFVTKTQYL